MDEKMIEDLIKKVEAQKGRRLQVLEKLNIPRSPYYKWRKAYREQGFLGLAKAKVSARRIWNKLTSSEVDRILEISRRCPELSPRLLAVRITDEQEFSVLESTVYRIANQ